MISICECCGRAELSVSDGGDRLCRCCGGALHASRVWETNLKGMLIRVLSANSDCYGDKLLEFMDRYRLSCLRDAETEKLMEFAVERGYVM